MSLTKEEALALAKNCGAAYGPTTDNICFLNREQLLAYTSAIEQKVEQKYQAQIAMLRNVLNQARNGIIWYSENSDDADDSDTEMLCEIDAVLNDTQQSAEAWEREVKARAVPDGYVAVPISKLTHEDCYRFGLDAAELRNQQEGKEGK